MKKLIARERPNSLWLFFYKDYTDDTMNIVLV